MNNQPATIETVIHAVESNFQQIASNEKLVVWAEESQFAIQLWQKNLLLQKCTPVSIQNAIINVAACGLSLNAARGLAFLVPEYDKATKQQSCQLRISFKGLMKVSVDSGAIDWVRAEIVRENDDFEYRGPCDKPTHKMNPFSDRGDMIGVYCIAKTGKNDILCDVMSKQEVDLIKSKAKTQFVWNDWYCEMSKKAIIKRASKQWPSSSKSIRFDETIQLINDVEGNEYNGLSEVIQAEPSQDEPIQPLAIEHYPQEQFDKIFPSWQKSVLNKEKTPEKILAFLNKKKVVLNQQQEQQIHNIGKS